MGGLSFDGFSSEAERQLTAYSFPGNARKLRNIVEQATILCRSGQIQTEHLHLPEHHCCKVTPISGNNANTERDLILQALGQTGGNRKKTAKVLNMPYSTLRYKMEKLDIKR